MTGFLLSCSPKKSLASSLEEKNLYSLLPLSPSYSTVNLPRRSQSSLGVPVSMMRPFLMMLTRPHRDSASSM